MNLQFGQPLAFWIFVVGAVLLSLWSWRSERRSEKMLRDFASSPMLARLAESVSHRRRKIKAILSLAGCLSLLLALAQPQWGSITEEIELEGVDILFALDTSRSMLAEDYTPNRLERAKLAITDLVTRLGGDRIGLIAFAGDAFLQSPLTLDYSAFIQTLNAMTTNTIPRGGTDVAGAIEEALAYFEETDHQRVLILISDGEDLEASGLERAREASEKGVTIFTVGVGSSEGELIPIRMPDGETDYVRDADGQPVLTRLDESSLRSIAEIGGGVYQRLEHGSSELDAIYRAAREAVDEAKLGSLTRETPIERYQWPLALGLIFLVSESLLGTRKKQKLRKKSREKPVKRSPAHASAKKHTASVVSIFLLLLLLLPLSGFASARKAERAYRSGNYEQAIALWQQASEEKPNDSRLRYNLGNALYRSAQFEAAISAYEEALPLADPELQERIFFNLGNAQYQLGESLRETDPEQTAKLWDEALKNFANSLALNPDAEDATGNRAWVEKQFSEHGAVITLTAHPPEGGTTSAGGRFLLGTNLPVEATAADGWRFVSWEGAEVEDPKAGQTVLIVQQNAELRALFVQTAELEVLSANPEHGTAGTSGRYDIGSEVPISAEASDYFAFKEWISDDLEIADPQSPQTTVRLTQAGTVTAHFVEAFHLEVVSDPPIAGNVGQTGFYEKRTTVPIQAAPRDGFSWLGWSGEDVPDIADFNSQETEIKMNGDRKAIAQFHREWNFVVLPDRDESGTTSGGGNFPIGTIQPIEAIPNEGFQFERWEGPGVRDPFSAKTEATVLSETHDLIAIFSSENDDENNKSDSDESGEDDSQTDNEEENSDPDQESDDEANDSSDEQQDSESDPETDDDEESAASEPESSESDETNEIDRESPESLTAEEAQLLLEMLRQNERQLPLRLRDADDKTDSTRDW